MAFNTAHLARPSFNRQRSNSVPTYPLINCTDEEAGLLFSTAERAAARRRRNLSVDEDGCAHTGRRQRLAVRSLENFKSSGSKESATRPSEPGRQMSAVAEVPTPPVLTAPPETESQSSPKSANKFAPTRSSTINNPPLSPGRVVPTKSLKAYADGLFAFTQSQLTTPVPSIPVDPRQIAPPTCRTPRQSIVSRASSEALPKRPHLRSHFSNWSTASTETDAEDEEEQDLPAMPSLTRGSTARTGTAETTITSGSDDHLRRPLSRHDSSRDAHVYIQGDHNARKDITSSEDDSTSHKHTLSILSTADSKRQCGPTRKSVPAFDKNEIDKLSQFDFQFDDAQSQRYSFIHHLSRSSGSHPSPVPKLEASPFFTNFTRPGGAHAVSATVACSPHELGELHTRSPMNAVY